MIRLVDRVIIPRVIIQVNLPLTFASPWRALSAKSTAENPVLISVHIEASCSLIPATPYPLTLSRNRNLNRNLNLIMPLEIVATFAVTERTSIIVAHGSILDFEPAGSPETAGIVNAANPTCIADFITGTNFLEQFVQQAGGERLLAARLEVPLVEGEEANRCDVGDAKILGPNKFGKLPTAYVIDAVGPNYINYPFEQYEDVDELLMSAYGSALERAKEKDLVEVATSLMSVDTKGRRSLKQVLAIGLSALGYWAQENPDTKLTSIIMCAPTTREADKIIECGKKLGLMPEEEKTEG